MGYSATNSTRQPCTVQDSTQQGRNNKKVGGMAANPKPDKLAVRQRGADKIYKVPLVPLIRANNAFIFY